jgi:adenylate cyclase
MHAISDKRDVASALYQEALKVVEGTRDRVGLARLQRKIGCLQWEAGHRDRAKVCFESGLAALDESDNAIERAQLFEEIGRLAFRTGDNKGAIGWAERALSVAGFADTPTPAEALSREAALARAQILNTLGISLARLGHPEDAVAKIRQSIGLAEAHDLPRVACRGYANLGVLYSSLDPQQSIQTCRRALDMANKVGDLALQSHIYANLAVAYCALTDRCGAEGIEAAQTAADLDRRIGLFDHLAVPLIVLGQIHQCRGEPEVARLAYEEALHLALATGEPQLLFPCYDGLATLNLEAGNLQRAEAFFAKSQEVCVGAGIAPEAFLVLPFLC